MLAQGLTTNPGNGRTYSDLLPPPPPPDPDATVTTLTYDNAGRKTSMSDPDMGDWSYTYDALGNLLTPPPPPDPDATVTTLTYDNAGRKTSMSDPDMGDWSYTYDALGNLTTQTDARLCTLTLTYDLLNRLDTKSSSGSGCNQQVSVDYDYDETAGGNKGIGRRTGMEMISGGATVTNAWTYDERGRVLSETVNAGTAYTTSWTYNSADMPVTMNYPDLIETVTYEYDARMLLDRLTNGTTVYVDDTTYDSAGRINVRTLGNLDKTDYDYYGWTQQGGRLQQLVTSLWNGSTYTMAQSLQYTYDNVGNVSTIMDADNSSQKQCFLYDSLDRLTRATTFTTSQSDPAYALGCDTQIGVGAYDQAYSYNSSTGNLATKGSLTLSYNHSSHPHAVSGVGSNTYSYDGNGHMTQRVVGGQTYNLGYDAEGRLVSVSGAITASFVYDGDGKRVKSTIAGVTTTFVGTYYEVQGSDVTKYYYAGAQRVAMRLDGHVYYLFGDHLGSTSLTVDTADNSVTSEILYTAWGEIRHPVDGLNPGPSNYTYTGQYSHSEDFGLMFYNARWYDPALGRFAQADMIIPGAGNSQAWDRYAYTNNNPVKYVDPSGHCGGTYDKHPSSQDKCWELAQSLEKYGFDFDLISQFNVDGIKLIEAAYYSVIGLFPAEGDSFVRNFNSLSTLGRLPDFDAVGIRIAAGGYVVAGAEVGFEMIINFRSREVSYFLVPSAGFGIALGGSGSAEVMVLFNLPNNASYREYALGLSGTVAVGKYGVSAGGSINTEPGSEETRAMEVRGGFAPGLELSLVLSVSYAVEVLRFDTQNGMQIMPDANINILFSDPSAYDIFPW